MVTIEQIRREHEESEDCEVQEQWLEMAREWAQDPDFFVDNFTGWNDRTTEAIILDFHINGQLTDELTDEQVKELEEKAWPNT